MLCDEGVSEVHGKAIDRVLIERAINCDDIGTTSIGVTEMRPRTISAAEFEKITEAMHKSIGHKQQLKHCTDAYIGEINTMALAAIATLGITVEK